MSAIHIRAAVAADVQALADLGARTWRDQFGDSLEAADLEFELAERRSPAYLAAALERHTILVAQLGDALVGYAEFGQVDLPDVATDPADAQLHRLYVDHALQGRGLGRRLLDSALRHPRLSGAPRVYLAVWEENTRALRLYDSAGFVRVSTTPYAVGDKQIGEDLVMCLERPPSAYQPAEEQVRDSRQLAG